MQFAGRLKDVDKPLVDSFYDSIVDVDSTEGIAALHAAITFGQTYNVLQVLKKRNPNINSCSHIDGLSALHRASKGGHLGIVKILLNYGASLDIPTSIDGIDTTENLSGLKCATSFHQAVANGHLNVARFLEEYGADINKPDTNSGITPLHSAITQSINIIDFLLKSPRQRHSSSTATLTGWTVLMEAADLGTFDIFKLFLQNSSSSAVSLQCESGFNCLHSAVLSKIDPYQKVAMLRQSCINPCIPTTDGFLPLHLAAACDFNTFRETLNFTLRSFSQNRRKPSTCKPIISRSFLQGSDSQWSIPNNTKRDAHILNFLTGSGQSILHEIVTKRAYTPSDSLRMLELLLGVTRDVNLEIQDENGRSPLLALCDSWVQRRIHVGNLVCLDFLPNAISLLLRHGAVATQQDHRGNTAMHYLCKSAKFTISEYRCMSYLLAIRHSKEENTNRGGRVDSTKQTTKDDNFSKYGEGEYDRERVDECSEGYDDANAEYNGNDDIEHLDDCLARTIDSTNDEVQTYKDTNTSLLLTNKSNTTALEKFFGKPNVFCNPAFQSFDIEIGLLLVSAASIDQLNKNLFNGRRLLQSSLCWGEDRLTSTLLDLGVDTISPDEGTPPRTALELLCIHGSRNKSVIKKIIMNHVDKTTLNSDGSSMLHLACIYGQINVFEELLHAGWQTDVSNQDGKPLILQAMESVDTTMVNLLLEHGSTLLDKYIYRSTIEFSLSTARNAMMCQLLNDNGINNWHQEATMSFWGQFLPDISTMKTRYSSPSPSGSTQWLSAAIERVTPLHIASFNGNETVIQYALDFGNNVHINLAAGFGTTPLFFAVYGGNIRNMEVLLSRGADVGKSPSKFTLLHLAAARGDETTVRLLLQYGADIQARDHMGRTPTSVAFNLGYKGVINLLNCNLAGSCKFQF